MDDDQSIDSLIDTLKRYDAQRYSGKPPPPQAIQERDEALRQLTEMGAAALQPLLDAVDEDDADGDLRHFESSSLRVALMGLGERAMTALLGVFTGKTGGISLRAAARTLGEYGGAGGVEPLIALAQDRHLSAANRRYAMEALGKLKDPRAVEPLIGLLSDTDNSIVTCAIFVLERYHDERVIPPLLRMLAHRASEAEHDYLPYYINRIITGFGDVAVAPLAAAQNSADPKVGAIATGLLRRLGKAETSGAEHAFRAKLETVYQHVYDLTGKKGVDHPTRIKITNGLRELEQVFGDDAAYERWTQRIAASQGKPLVDIWDCLNAIIGEARR